MSREPSGIFLAKPEQPGEGIRLAVKDLFDTAGLTTTYGSIVYADHVPTTSAEVVTRLEAAGYANVGKTNLHEFAYGITSVNPHYGTVPNPAAPGHMAGGSSGGSAAALAAGLADAALGTTVTPTALSSGTVANTVPATGAFAVDVRMWDTAEQARVHAAMSSLLPAVPDAVLEVSGGPNRPPLAAASSAALFSLASSVAAELGLAPLESASVGGASDGNFTAGVGTPTLDGLGAVGGGAHADHEHVLVDALPGRAALLAALIDDLLAGALATGGPAARGDA